MEGESTMQTNMASSKPTARKASLLLRIAFLAPRNRLSHAANRAPAVTSRSALGSKEKYNMQHPVARPSITCLPFVLQQAEEKDEWIRAPDGQASSF